MKVFKVFVLVFSLFAILCTLSANFAHAQECENIDGTEFHSLRPYPAKSCIAATENYAKFCGNTLTLQSKITVPYQPGVDKCTPIAGGKVRCSYIKQGGGNITIDLSNANLPIMGNTEDVTPNASPDMTDAQKVNEYVSWYLNGVINKKEYPPSQDNKQIVNYTGPINKLLPAEIQETSRATTVKNAKITRHDQIVGCVDLLGLGKINTCDPNNILQKKARLSDWENNLPPERSEFDNAHDYQVEYSRWRGNSCIEIFGLAFCFDSPWKVNWPGKLFSNIPLSSTEDLEGNIKVSSVSVGGEGVSNVSFSNQTPATLFFPHIQESDELGSILQDTYLAKDEAKTGQNVAVEPPSSCTTVDVRSNKGDNLFAKSISGNLGYTASFSCVFDAVPNPATCATTGNPCDGGKLCCTGSFCNNEGQHSYCRKSSTLAPATPLIQTCSKTFSVSLSTLSNTPKIDDVWSRLVAGPTAVVKRMFPKLGTQIGTLKDLPGSTGITYSGDVQGSGELNLPHIGGISEYFLKGIQTLLRPKGYGEPISFGENNISDKKGFSCEKNVLPDIPKATENACKICNPPSNIPKSMIDVMEAAGQAYNVPASVIYATFMYEGGSHYTWTEEMATSSMCEGVLPGCDKNANSVAQPPYGWIPTYFYDYGYWDAVKVVKPDITKDQSSPCNFLDATFATAKGLAEWSPGLPTSVRFPTWQDPSQTFSRFPDVCWGFNINNGTGIPGSCDAWNANTVATTQVGYAGYCFEPGKHPIQTYFQDNSIRMGAIVNYYNNLKCQ